MLPVLCLSAMQFAIDYFPYRRGQRGAKHYCCAKLRDAAARANGAVGQPFFSFSPFFARSLL
jgi:hypothetical protein